MTTYIVLEAVTLSYSGVDPVFIQGEVIFRAIRSHSSNLVICFELYKLDLAEERSLPLPASP